MALPSMNEDFRKLIHDLDPELEFSSPRSVDLVLAKDLPVRIVLHPDERHVLIELYVYDAALLTGEIRATIVDTLLLLNHASQRGHTFAVGLDSRDFVAIFGRYSLRDFNEGRLLDSLNYLQEQALRIRSLIKNLTMEEGHATLAFDQGAASEQTV